MESGTIVRWLKGEGDPVRRNEPLYELDTDKVTQEVEAEADGVLLKILVRDGEVGVGTTVAVIGAEGEDPSLRCRGRGADRSGSRPLASAARHGESEPEAPRDPAPAPPRRPGAQQRSRQGKPARASDRTRAGGRSRLGRRHGPRRPRHREGRRVGGAWGAAASAPAPRRARGGAGARSRSSSSRRPARRSRAG